MSFLPAQRYGLKDRGVIREGAYADVVIFNPSTVHDTATYADPLIPATGINFFSFSRIRFHSLSDLL